MYTQVMRFGPSIAILFLIVLLAACIPSEQKATDTPPINTSTPVPQPTQPAPTEILFPTSAPASEYHLYTFWYQRNYGMQIFKETTASALMEIDGFDVGHDDNYSREIELNGPGDAAGLAFSHFSNKVAYWTWGEIGALWVSDLANENPQPLFVDTEAQYPVSLDYEPGETMMMEWTPDDQHIIVNFVDNLSMIYHLESDEFEPWPYTCDRVALSPRTQKLATWCRHTNETEAQNEFGVLEWGGEVWISEQVPETELVNQTEEFYPFWNWSPNGEIAFFDLDDEGGYLYIADIQGNILLQSLPESAYWFVEKYGVSKWAVQPTSISIIWSHDGKRMAVYAIGYEQNACPPFEWHLADEPVKQVPCWHVFDIDAQEIIWSVTDTLNQLDPNAFEDLLWDITPWSFYNTAISPEGKYILIRPYPDSFIISLETGALLWQNRFSFDTITWGETLEIQSPP